MAESWLPVAERVVSEKFGREVRMEPGQLLTEEQRRSSVTRHSLSQGAPGTPETVVVKRANLQNLEGRERDWVYQGFLNDLAGVKFLDATLGATSPAPRFYGADSDASLFVFEDLGELNDLVPRLIGSDPQSASEGLIRLATTLGKMHASTMGRASVYESMRAGLGPLQPNIYRALGGNNALKRIFEKLGIDPSTRFWQEIEAVLGSIFEPGPFMAYTHGDPCPDNCTDTESQFKLFDFELGGFQHALLDASFARFMFPTCWCAGRLPQDVWANWERVYRSELAASCPEATDDEMFYRGMLDCCAYWAALTMVQWLNSALEEDQVWGIATRRQRILARLKAFTEFDEVPSHLDETRRVYEATYEKLIARWSSDVDDFAPYPAFS